MISGSAKSYADAPVAEPIGYTINCQSKGRGGARKKSSLTSAQYSIESGR